ncbi:hypothetical protein H0H87_009611 [Tephrocybe sp. NHM501043]|nr:hypothetical protein H0H87_009611 [Tephrocybe sp. NHM501043]
MPEHYPPKVGQTRCYWALLSADLDFIYLDPVLQAHLAEQALLLKARSLLSFVHPDEQASAKIDLGGVLESRTLHGSVTRVRFSRLSRVRRLLGHDGPAHPWQDADKIALDDNYMAVDIVINWAADGLVLCFIHAIVDLSPTDNDELNKTGWTNWCGTPRIENHQIQMCYNYLIAAVPPTPPSPSHARVFQILDNRDSRPLLLSWPPDQGQGTHRPNARDFAALVENAQIGTSGQDGPSGNDSAKTSCTRRYKALQTMPSVPGSQVESIFIPHGYYDTPYPLPPLSSSAAYTSYPYAPQRWNPADYPQSQQQTQQQQQQPQAQQNQWGSGSPSPAHSVSSLPPAVSNLRAGSYPPSQFPGGPQGSPFIDTFRAGSASPYLTASPSHPTSTLPPLNQQQGPPSLSQQQNNPNQGTTSYSPTPDFPTLGPSFLDNDAASAGAVGVPSARRRASAENGGRVREGGNRPNGVLKCSSCKATTSPEWRKGPSGRKELCNA